MLVMAMNMQRYIEGYQLVMWLHVIVEEEATKNANIEDYLERTLYAVELRSESTARSEVEECIYIMNKMDEIPCRIELYFFILNLFTR